MLGDAVALVRDARFPTRAALARLIAPFEQVQQENAQSADQLALLGPAHAVDFLGDVLDVGLCELAGVQELGLLAAPAVEITIVERALRGMTGRENVAAAPSNDPVRADPGLSALCRSLSSC
jgi:hypothetical protein